MKALKSLALAGVLLLCALMPADAKTIIAEDNGGKVVQYVKKYSDMRDSGEKVVIDGDCVSSCTIFLGVLKPKNVCATDKATFGFHSASYVAIENGKEVYTHSAEISELMFNLYPTKVRRLLKRRGWDGEKPHPELIWVRGRSLYNLVRKCAPADLS